MDISDSFRAEDITKTDLFDFVVNNDTSTDNLTNTLPHFGRSLKSFGIYLESSTAATTTSTSHEDNDNNNNNSNNSNNNNNPTEECDKLINIENNRKEKNNNNLLISNGAVQYMDTTSYWMTGPSSVSSCKDDSVVRWEHSMLEDLNCWTGQDNCSSSSASTTTTTKQLVCAGVGDGTDNNNTDGAIYTLTVLNGTDQNSTWYRLPDTVIHHENDDSNHHNSTIQQQNTAPSSIDFDSLLNNIIPSSLQQTNLSSFPSTYCTVNIQDNISSSRNNLESNNNSSNSNNNNNNNKNNNNNSPSENSTTEVTSPIKTEFLYEDNFPDRKNVVVTAKLPFNNSNSNNNSSNNNSSTSTENSNSEWKLTETSPMTSSSTDSRVNSLLRSALQGKSNSFISRYNGANTHPIHTHSIVSIKPEKLENSPSISSCKDTTTSGTTSSNSGFTELDDSMKTQSPLMAVSLEGGTVVMFDGGTGSGSMIVDSDNPSSAQSMDDIFLSHLDTVTYAEDYEKLKSIENEVAKSVEQYCTNPYLTPSHISTDITRIPSIPHHLDHTVLNAIPSTTSSSSSSSSSTKPGSKKYSKRLTGSNKTATGGHNHQLHQTTTSGGGNNSSTSSGIRKERSLHYCTICHKGFKDKYSVNVHVRTHTGEKPFTCTFCGKNFRQKAHLAKHHHTHSVQKNTTSNVSGNSSSKPQNTKHR